MTITLKAKQPFTDWVPNQGMVVFNEGDEDSLPDAMAQRRIDGGFAVAVRQKGMASSETAAPDPEPAPRKVGRPPKPRPDDATTDAPVD